VAERIPLVDPDDEGIDASTRELLRALQQSDSGFNVIRAIANHAGLLQGFMALGGAIYGGAALDPRLRELAYLTVSTANRCHY
jgi:alkylhydroperoxidase family enzyme